jgi:hypothetical protein
VPQHFYRLLAGLPHKLDTLEERDDRLSPVTQRTQVFLPGLPHPLHLIEHQGAVSPNLQPVLAHSTVGPLTTANQVLQSGDQRFVLSLIIRGSRRELEALGLAATGCGRNLVPAVRFCIMAAVVPGATVEDDQ